MSKQRIKQVDKEFEDSINKIRQKIAKDMGFDINFTDTTRMIGKIVDDLDLGFEIKDIPKSKKSVIKTTVRRKRRR